MGTFARAHARTRIGETGSCAGDRAELGLPSRLKGPIMSKHSLTLTLLGISAALLGSGALVACSGKTEVAQMPDGGSNLLGDGSTGSCPALDPESGGACTGAAHCEYRQECCCGACHPSTICDCSKGAWACSATDAC